MIFVRLTTMILIFEIKTGSWYVHIPITMFQMSSSHIKTISDMIQTYLQHAQKLSSIQNEMQVFQTNPDTKDMFGMFTTCSNFSDTMLKQPQDMSQYPEIWSSWSGPVKVCICIVWISTDVFKTCPKCRDMTKYISHRIKTHIHTHIQKHKT